MTDSDRRTGVRVVVNEEFAQIDILMTEYVSNISRGGIFLRCDQLLPMGTEVDLRFTVLIEGMETIEGRGEVVHHGQGSDLAGLGIRFVELTPTSQAIIDDLYARDLITDDF